MASTSKQLHWTQRVALVRHNLHAAGRSGDFTFFKTLQAKSMIEGDNHVAQLSDALGDDADDVLAGLDDLNAGIAHLHEDAFKNVYDGLKDFLHDQKRNRNSDDPDVVKAGRSKVYVDSTMQKQMATHAIDKMTSSATALIQVQPVAAQDAATNVWIAGATVIADCIEVCHQQMAMMGDNMEDFIRLEDSWETVKASVGHAVAALKGVFNLMTVEDTEQDGRNSRASSFSVSSGSVFRRLSNAFSGAQGPPSRSSSIPRNEQSRPPSVVYSGTASSSRTSLVPEYRTPNYLRNSISSGMPTSLPDKNGFQHTQLDTIPPTPAAAREENVNPFDMNFPPVPNMPPIVTLPELRITAHVI